MSGTINAAARRAQAALLLTSSINLTNGRDQEAESKPPDYSQYMRGLRSTTEGKSKPATKSPFKNDNNDNPDFFCHTSGDPIKNVPPKKPPRDPMVINPFDPPKKSSGN